MDKERLENEEIIKDNDQVEVEVEEKEDVDGNCRHILPCFTNTRKKCESDCWPAANCYLSCNK